ncbi:MAG: efflux RND transporter periplasmic adaptor subunit [Proteobacteria bacterium]|nr:efflux RND transporter periplasmic adaptor subunit [Pseudomonadota bacterium]
MAANQKTSSASPRQRALLWVALAAIIVVAGGVWAVSSHNAKASVEAQPASVAGKVQADVVRIAPDQAAALDVGAPQEQAFQNLRHTIGIIDFNQDRSTRVYASHQGRIAQVLVKAGDDVKAGQTLYTVDVPDMTQAASTLISAAGALRASNETLRRAEALAREESIPQKELQQAQADQQSAQAAYDAARQGLRLFELGDADIARIERERRVGREMAVKSPMAGRITARAAQPGLLVQPGTDPAPVTVSDLRTLWMVASVPESDFSYYRIGQPVQVRVQAWPGKLFSGKISYLGDSIDPDTRRFAVRAEVADPKRELRPQMTADFQFTIAAPQTSVAVPAEAVVREGNGDDVVWVASDSDAHGPRFTRRKVTRGQTSDGLVQITAGLAAGERIARHNALFLSSLYETDAAADAN